MTVTHDWWTWNTSPTEPGWYPVLVCYDPYEGTFPTSAHWVVDHWNQKSVIAYGGRCDTEAEATWVAYQHDPDW